MRLNLKGPKLCNESNRAYRGRRRKDVVAVSSDGVFMKRSSRPRRTTELSQSLHQQLNMYALAASAAGVTLLVPGANCAPRHGRISLLANPRNVCFTWNKCSTRWYTPMLK